MRIIVDTNIFVSFLLTPNKHGTIAFIIDTIISQKDITVLIPDELIKEIVNTTSKEHLKRKIRHDDIQTLITILEEIGESLSLVVEKTSIVTRDPKDDYLLTCATIGQANYLVTGDDDLTNETVSTAAKNQGLIILTPSDFVLVLKKIYGGTTT